MMLLEQAAMWENALCLLTLAVYVWEVGRGRNCCSCLMLHNLHASWFAWATWGEDGSHVADMQRTDFSWFLINILNIVEIIFHHYVFAWMITCKLCLLSSDYSTNGLTMSHCCCLEHLFAVFEKVTEGRRKCVCIGSFSHPFSKELYIVLPSLLFLLHQSSEIGQAE